MIQEEFDAIVIGAGQAGPAIAARCSEAGLRVAVVERHLAGGTCVNSGCTPTKALVASARAIHIARRGAEYGFDAREVRPNIARVKARMDAIVRASRDGVERWMRNLDRVEWIVGNAYFVGPRNIRVGDRLLTAPKVFINVGGRAARPALQGINDVATLDNVSILGLNEIPSHLVIVGGSYIGLEFAQVMRRFDAEVTVVERSDRLLPKEDAEVGDGVRAILEADGVRFRLGADCISLARRETGIGVGVRCEVGDPLVDGSHVLLAMGRVPNTDGMQLDTAGIRTDARGYIEVDDQCRASADGIWAVGDCNGRGAFTHTAWNDYEVVVANLFDHELRSIGDRLQCYALFIDPPLGRVGMNEAQVRASKRPALVATMSMQRVGRARESGETQGFMKAFVDAKTGRILGATILGLNGDEVVHGLLDVMAADLPYTALARAVHIHPTVSELVPTLLQQLRPLK